MTIELDSDFPTSLTMLAIRVAKANLEQRLAAAIKI